MKRTCTWCLETKDVGEFIRGNHVNNHCEDCQEEPPNKTGLKIESCYSPVDLIWHSFNDSNTLFVLTKNGNEITVKHKNGCVLKTSKRLSKEAMELIKQEI